MNPFFIWRGKRYEGKAIDGTTLLACPICGDGIVFSKDGSPQDEMWLPHHVATAPDGALTISPSVVCPRNCGWHVVISNGLAE
jgi:hypothetical protein